ncbi:MAG: DUF2249 domain-containing protein [Chloroflexota bacterium]
MEQSTLDLDVRELIPRERHERIFSELALLERGHRVRLINDHDPKPLHYQLLAEHPAEFDWDEEEMGPERWVVAITRRINPEGDGKK